MTDLTLPLGLIEEWAHASPIQYSDESWAYEMFIAHKAAQWGADAELDACCNWLDNEIGASDPKDLRKDRIKEQSKVVADYMAERIKCKYWDCGWCYAPKDVETSSTFSGACLTPNFCPYLNTEMTNLHPITPPPELRQQWRETWYTTCDASKVKHVDLDEFVATQAAQWGADQELDACCAYLTRCAAWEPEDVKELRDLRHPKPPSLKEQALALLDNIYGHISIEEEATLRRALEQLDD